VQASAASLHGRVVDPDGRPVANAEVIVSGATAAPLRARTDRDGKFEIVNLADGRYTIVATAPGLVSEPLAIDAGPTPAPIEIALKISALNETLVVSASQIDQPTVVAHRRQRQRDWRSGDRRQAAVHARRDASLRRGPDGAAKRRTGHGHVALHPRR
jgi:hypothetical protein